MTPNFKLIIQTLAFAAFLLACAIVLPGCTPTLAILDGATHACGTVHIEGYFSDTQGEVIIAKTPNGWTPEQVQEFCSPE